MMTQGYTIGIVEQNEVTFLASWSDLRQLSMEQDGYTIKTVRFTGLDRNQARQIVESHNGAEI